MKIEFAADHKAGMRVPKGGSSCASCEYLRPKMTCANEYFQKWNGGNKIPAKNADEYCSDWYSPKSTRSTVGETLKAQRSNK